MHSSAYSHLLLQYRECLKRCVIFSRKMLPPYPPWILKEEHPQGPVTGHLPTYCPSQLTCLLALTHTHTYSLQRGSVGSRAKVSIVPRVTCSTGICWCPQPLLLTCGWAYCTAHLSLRAVQRMAQDLLQWLGSGAMAQADLLEGP